MSGALMNTADVLRVAGQNAGGMEQRRQEHAAGNSPPAPGPLDVMQHTGRGLAQEDLGDSFMNHTPAGAMVGLFNTMTSPPAATAPSAIPGAMGAGWEATKQAAAKIGEAEGPLATFGAAFGTLTAFEQMLSMALSAIPFPAFPAIRITDMDVGLPHAHSHPPNLIPPAPPVPLPSTGPVIPIPFLSGANQSLINSLPAGRCGDMGLGIWCGGYFPMYEIFLGSSSVWIEGARAARLAVDITKHCVFTTPKPSDPPLGPMIGFTITSSANVLIGGVPMPSLSNMAMGAALKGVMKGVGAAARAITRAVKKGARAFNRVAGKVGKRLGRNMKPGFMKCRVLRAEPVNVTTGEVVVDHCDYTIKGRLPLAWTRSYRSQSAYRGACGLGWTTPADARLEIDDDGLVLFHDGAGDVAMFDSLPTDQNEHRELVDGSVLYRVRNGYEVRTKDNLTYHFVTPEDWSDGWLADRITDGFGNYLRFLRNQNGLFDIDENATRRIRVTSEGGRILKMSLLTPDAESPVALVRYDYDHAGQLVAVYDAADHAYRFDYRDGRMIRHTDRNGLSFGYAYDAGDPGADDHAKCIHAWGPEGLYDYHFKYRDRETKVVDSLGGVTNLKLNNFGLPVEEIDPLGRPSRYQYDAAGRTIAVIDPLGQTSSWAYDESGNLLEEARPDGAVTTYVYDTNHRCTEITLPGGGQWQFTWNDGGSMVGRVSPAGGRWQYRYNDLGDPVASVNPLGAELQVEHDGNGAVRRVVDADGGSRTFARNVRGEITRMVDPTGGTTTFRYSPTGMLVRTESPGGAISHFDYDREGNLTRQQDPAGNATTFRYYGLGEISEIRYPDGARVRFTYDTEERLSCVTNELGQRYTFDRNSAGDIVGKSDFHNQAFRYQLDPLGRITEEIGPLGRRIRYEYDAAGRLTGRHSGSGDFETFAYDPDGNLIALENSTGIVSRQFDTAGRLVVETQGDFSLEYEYDAADNCVKRVSAHGHEIEYQYNADSTLQKIDLDGRLVCRVERDPASNTIRESLGDHLVRTVEFDTDGRVRIRRIERTGEPVSERRFEYDPVGNLIARHDPSGRLAKFHYDLRGRLTEFQQGGSTQRFDYDPSGTRVDDLRQQNEESSRNRLRRLIGGQTYEFDDVGNLRKRQSGESLTEFTWNDFDRLVGAVGSDGTRTDYHYDAAGRRVAREDSRGRRKFFYDGDGLHSEESDAGGVREYIHYPGTFVPVAFVEDGQVHYIETDNVGLPHEVYRSDGEMSWSGIYDAFGSLKETPHAAIEFPLRFQNQYADEAVGLHYTRNRYYAPSSGEFISSDPIGLAGGISVHQYAPNPWAWADPLGLSCTVVTAPSRAAALRRAQQHAQVPRVSRGGQEIPFDELNASSRGRNAAEIQSRGGKNIGRRDPNSAASVMDHPDGHPHQVGPEFPDHHAHPHVHATNANGEELIVTYPGP